MGKKKILIKVLGILADSLEQEITTTESHKIIGELLPMKKPTNPQL